MTQKPPRTFESFGQWLKAHRESLRLTLRDVAALSKTISPTQAGQISDGYLAQLEGGRRGKVGLEKLYTLATVYGLSSSQLLDAVPDEMPIGNDVPPRDKPAHSLKWSERRPAPLPQVQQVNRSLQAAARGKCVGFTPAAYTDPSFYHDESLDFLLRVATPAYLKTQEGHGRLRFFWSYLSKDLDTLDTVWFSVPDAFDYWLKYEAKLGLAVLAVVSQWKADHREGVASVHFHNPRFERQFAFDDVFIRLVEELRSRELMAALAQSAPRRIPRPADLVVKQLSPLEASVRYATELFRRSRSREQVAAAVKALLDIADRCHLDPDSALLPDVHESTMKLIFASKP